MGGGARGGHSRSTYADFGAIRGWFPPHGTHTYVFGYPIVLTYPTFLLREDGFYSYVLLMVTNLFEKISNQNIQNLKDYVMVSLKWKKLSSSASDVAMLRCIKNEIF